MTLTSFYNFAHAFPGNCSSGDKGPVLAVDVINSAGESSNDDGSSNEKKDQKKSTPTANTEELGRALTKSFRYNLVSLVSDSIN